MSNVANNVTVLMSKLSDSLYDFKVKVTNYIFRTKNSESAFW